MREGGTNLACSAVANKHKLEAWSRICHRKFRKAFVVPDTLGPCVVILIDQQMALRGSLELREDSGELNYL